MTDVAPTDSSETVNGTESVPNTQTSDADAQSNKTEMSEIERIKAAHAARRSRRSRGASSLSVPTPTESKSQDAPADEDPAVAKVRKEYEDQVSKLTQDLSNIKLEMASLRRNHLQNIKQITHSRDMFAMQLAKEQTGTAKTSTTGAKKLEDMEVQLRAARTRNNDLENENTVLREEVKQLNFRVQASKTLDAASDGYEKIVSELVETKVKCAQLEEEKEELLRMNKELSSTSHVLREANGELEKSRSHWVVQCAEIERQRTELEAKIKEYENATNPSTEAPSDTGSLQDVKLN
ncbi:hypothetical protein FGB62_127g18 [Gracilaria domingensis]|nr:hypothetical protein FGB62_127g18 [Gracilaria domingensis]